MILLAILLPLVPAQDWKVPKPFTAAEKAEVRAAFADILKDPSSAEIRWLPVSDPMTYCGWVNAKNSYGGYTGYTAFAFQYHRDEKGLNIRGLALLDGKIGSDFLCRVGKYNLKAPPSSLPLQ